MLTYSYKVFSEEDISTKYSSIYTQKTIEDLNNFDLSKKDEYELKTMFRDLLKYARKYYEDTAKPLPILFKNLRLIESDIQYTWNYYDFDDAGNGGLLECGIYQIINSEFKLKLDFKIKFQHIYQMLLDMERWLTSLYNNKEINQNFVPMFVWNPLHLCYYRFNRVYQTCTTEFVYKEMRLMYMSLQRYLGLNALAFKAYKNNDSFEYDVFEDNGNVDGKKHFIQSGDKVPYHEMLEPVVNENKNVVVHLDVKHKIDLTIKPTSRDTITGTQRKKCPYQYEVKGHWHSYWVGSKGEKVKISKWVNPYIKGKDKQYKIVKHFKE